MKNKTLLVLLCLLPMATLIGCSVKLDAPADNDAINKSIKMLEEAKKYLNYKPTINYKYYVRANERDKVGIEFNTSVAYSFGNKDTYDHFKEKIDKTWWANSWSDYQDFKVGLFNTETDWGSYDYAPTKWAGVDCSGLVQRAAYEAGYRFSNLPNKGDIGSGECNKFGGETNAHGLSYYFNSRVTDSRSFTITWVGTGDVVFYPDAYNAYHVGIVSDVDKANNIVLVVSALGPYRVHMVAERPIDYVDGSFAVYRWSN